MTEYIIPLQPIPNQKTSVLVGGQNLTFEVFIIEGGALYANVYIDDTLIIGGTKCNAGITLNQYNTQLTGYLTWLTLDGYDPTYETIGTTSFLIWSDYSIEDALFAEFMLTYNEGS